MLCQFTFKNFESYKNETIFDLQAVSNQGFADSLLKSNNDEKEFLPVSVIYGPNAGGKSNVLKALNCIYALVVKPVLYFKNKVTSNTTIVWSPFLFDNKSRNEPTEFELFFRPDSEFEYKYNVSILNNKVVNESLYRRKIGPRNRIVMIFKRSPKEIVLGSCINRRNINTKVNDQMLFLSFLEINYKIKPISLAVEWFEKCMFCDYGNPAAERGLIMIEDSAIKKKVVNLMNAVGINISDFEYIEKSHDDNLYDIYFEHTINNEKFRLNINQESDGTQKLFKVLPFVIMALTEGRVLVIDELDAKLHPKLLRLIIMLFKNPKINTKNAQLIFTSHDVSTMKSSVFRTDEIWFACKLEDESSDLYSLYELRDDSGNHIQPSAAFDKQYLEGRYGADPYFQNMINWE